MILIPNSALTLDCPSCYALAIRFFICFLLGHLLTSQTCSFCKRVWICNKDTGSKTALIHLPNCSAFQHVILRPLVCKARATRTHTGLALTLTTRWSVGLGYQWALCSPCCQRACNSHISCQCLRRRRSSSEQISALKIKCPFFNHIFFLFCFNSLYPLYHHPLPLQLWRREKTLKVKTQKLYFNLNSLSKQKSPL